jgi:uncharacterized repeat protein (TIGR01451 family)
MKVQNIPAFVLAIALQLAPICRLACLNQTAPTVGFAVVFRCSIGAAALLGSYHAVSAASAAIAGVSNTNPVGPVTTNATGKVGQPFSYRIIVTNPGKDHAQDFWNAVPLPSGLTINTNVGGNGWITGSPSSAGVYPVTLTAGNLNSPIIVTKDITISIQGTAVSAPTITGPPASQIVSTGATVSFTVNATGDSLTYLWQFNGTNLPNANTASLTLSSVTPAQSGLYTVVVSNSAASIPSAAAQLLVVAPPDLSGAPTIGLLSTSGGQTALSFARAAGYRYVVEYSNTLSANSWTTLTNFAPSYVAGTVNLPETVAGVAQRFYRVQVSAN